MIIHVSLYNITLTLSLFYGSGKTHYKPITYCYYFLSDNQFVASHRSHESHKERIVTLAFAIQLKTLGEADKLRALCDAASVRFLGRAKRKHCEICVKSNICERRTYWT